MASDSEDALRWEGDESAPTLPPGWRAVGKGSEQVGATPESSTAEPGGQLTEREGAAEAGRPDTRAEEPAGMSTAMLVTLGILGGIYALYVVGWIIGGARLQGAAEFLVTDVGYQASFVLAIAAPFLWFLTTWVLTLSSRSWVRIAGLLGGAVLLVPWPFVMMGAMGA